MSAVVATEEKPVPVKFLPYTGDDDGLPRLRDYQEATILRIMDEPTKGALIADEMGRGKTVTAVEIARRMCFERVLVVGVKDTYDQWAERFALQSDGAIVLRRLDSTAKGKVAMADMLAGKHGYFFAGSQFLATQDYRHDLIFDGNGNKVWSRKKTTREIITKENTKIGPRLIPVQETKRVHLKLYSKMPTLDAVIVDEVHTFGNRTSAGIKTLRTLKTEWKIAMSGTWIGNRFENAHTITRWIWKDLIESNYYTWRADLCATETVYVGKDDAKTVIVGERNPGEFANSLPCYIRAEAPKAPPPIPIYVGLTDAQREQYEAFEEDMMAWVRSHPLEVAAGVAQAVALPAEDALDPIVAKIPIALRARLRTCTLGELVYEADGKIGFAMDSASSKIAALGGILQHWAGQQIVIGTHSKRFAKILVARMRAVGYNAVEWSGDVTSTERKVIKKAFLAGEIQYLVTVIEAFSTGLDGFQTVCNKLVTMSPSENNIVMQQWIARIYRPGMTEVNGGYSHFEILAENTLETGVFASLAEQTIRNADTLRLAA